MGNINVNIVSIYQQTILHFITYGYIQLNTAIMLDTSLLTPWFVGKLRQPEVLSALSKLWGSRLMDFKKWNNFHFSICWPSVGLARWHRNGTMVISQKRTPFMDSIWNNNYQGSSRKPHVGWHVITTGSLFRSCFAWQLVKSWQWLTAWWATATHSWRVLATWIA